MAGHGGRHEGTKTRSRSITMLSKHTDFDADLEDLAHRVIGCCLAVHRELGAGFVEAAYARAVRVELTASNISFESEKKYPICCSRESDASCYDEFRAFVSSWRPFTARHS